MSFRKADRAGYLHQTFITKGALAALFIGEEDGSEEVFVGDPKYRDLLCSCRILIGAASEEILNIQKPAYLPGQSGEYPPGEKYLRVYFGSQRSLTSMSIRISKANGGFLAAVIPVCHEVNKSSKRMMLRAMKRLVTNRLPPQRVSAPV